MFERRAVDVLGNELGAGLLELGLRLRQVDARDDAGVELVLHDLGRAREGRHRGLEEQDALLGDAHREIVDRHVGLRRQPGVGEVGGARLGGRRIAFDLAPDTPPQVGLPVERRARSELAQAARARADDAALGAAAATGAAAALGVTGVAADRRIEARRILPHQGARLTVGRFGLHEGLVGDVDLRRHPIEHGIAVHRPPRPAVNGVTRLGGPEGLGAGGTDHRSRRLLELKHWRVGRRRPLVIRADHAGRERQGRGQDHGTTECRHAGAAPALPSTRATRLGRSRSRRRKRSR
jgi:hypothetical protein